MLTLHTMSIVCSQTKYFDSGASANMNAAFYVCAYKFVM